MKEPLTRKANHRTLRAMAKLAGISASMEANHPEGTWSQPSLSQVSAHIVGRAYRFHVDVFQSTQEKQFKNLGLANNLPFEAKLYLGF